MSVSKTKDITYELIVVDNKSKMKTRILLVLLKIIGKIDRLYFNSENSLFAKGNNIASKLTSKDSTHYLLLNSDVSIKDPYWLKKLIAIHPEDSGISALGFVDAPPKRADGYCLLINKELYDTYRLDEHYEWWWAVTKLEAQVLKVGKKIVAVADHDNLLVHYGGKSGKGYIHAKGMDVDIEEVIQWFGNHQVTKLEKLD